MSGRLPGPILTVQFVEQARRVAELLEAGYSNRRIAEELGVSSPRISQIRSRLPSVRQYLGDCRPTARLERHREQLWSLRREALALAAAVRHDLRDLEEELSSAEVDRILGLREA